MVSGFKAKTGERNLTSRPAVILLTYQRCGSTFTAEMFNQNKHAFYMFEPVDGVYSDIYGTRQGFNVPSDIYNYWNGTERW